jgi:hypothetical protein
MAPPTPPVRKPPIPPTIPPSPLSIPTAGFRIGFVDELDAGGTSVGVEPLPEKETGTGAGVAGLASALGTGLILTFPIAGRTLISGAVPGLGRMFTLNSLHWS